jgi:hypothetical protein
VNYWKAATVLTNQSMAVELDHLFICVSRDADEASALAAVGLSEGKPNVHPGQGTACRRFFFLNGYIELLWVSNEAEAQSEVIQPTHLWERWAGRASSSCPFGFGFRPRAHDVASPPFPAWEYRPPYLPESWSFQVATNAAVLTEPMLFYLPFLQRPDARPSAERQKLEHEAGLREITRVEMLSPSAESLSPALTAVVSAGLVRMRRAKEYLVEVGFDGESLGRVADCRPALPLVLHW